MVRTSFWWRCKSTISSQFAGGGNAGGIGGNCLAYAKPQKHCTRGPHNKTTCCANRVPLSFRKVIEDLITVAPLMFINTQQQETKAKRQTMLRNSEEIHRSAQQPRPHTRARTRSYGIHKYMYICIKYMNAALLLLTLFSIVPAFQTTFVAFSATEVRRQPMAESIRGLWVTVSITMRQPIQIFVQPNRT